MIKLTDIVYYGNGFVATFDDNSVANTQFKVVDGKLTVLGLNPKQKAAMDAFNTSIDTSDPRFQGSPEAMRSMIEETIGSTPTEEAWANDYCYSFNGTEDTSISQAGRGQTGQTFSGAPTTNGYSVSFWMKFTDWAAAKWYELIVKVSAGSAWNSPRFEIFGKGANGGPVYSGHLRLVAREYATVGGPGPDVLSPHASLLDNTWQHFVITSTSTTTVGGDIKIYIDAGTSAIGVGAGLPQPLFDTVTVGCEVNAVNYTGPNSIFGPGFIDEIAIYNKALSASEVFDIYALGKAVDLKTTGPSSSLLTWYRFGDAPGDATQNGIIRDQKGIADLTMIEFPSGYGRVADGPSE